MTDTRTAPVRTSTTDVPTYRWYAAGQWRDAAGSNLFDDFEPYTGSLYARVPDCGADEAKIAIAAANDAFPAWAGTPPVEKARLFFKAAEIVRRRRSEIAEILARETGSTIPFSTFQQDLVAATLEQAANWVYLPKGEVLQSNLPDTHSIGVRRPLGVVRPHTGAEGLVEGDALRGQPRDQLTEAVAAVVPPPAPELSEPVALSPSVSSSLTRFASAACKAALDCSSVTSALCGSSSATSLPSVTCSPWVT